MDIGRTLLSEATRTLQMLRGHNFVNAGVGYELQTEDEQDRLAEIMVSCVAGIDRRRAVREPIGRYDAEKGRWVVVHPNIVRLIDSWPAPAESLKTGDGFATWILKTLGINGDEASRLGLTDGARKHRVSRGASRPATKTSRVPSRPSTK